jgi:hypothetical protein
MMETAVTLTQAIDVFKPLMVEVLQLAFVGIAGFISQRVYAWFGFQLTEQQWQVVHSAAEAAAGKIWAVAEPSIATAKIEVSSPEVAKIAQAAIDLVPKAIKATGITPDEFVELVVSKIGVLQSRAAAPVSVASLEKAAA